MGTPRRSFTICGLNACTSVKALLDTGSDMTLLSRELAEKVGALTLSKAISMKSATGQTFPAQEAIIAGHLNQECDGLFRVGITDKKNLGGETAIIGNDIMASKCMKMEFEPEQPSLPQSVRLGCNCHKFFTEE